MNYISKIVPSFRKNYRKCEQKQSNVHKTLNLDNSLYKTKSKKKLIPYSRLYVLFKDTTHPLIILYDEYISTGQNCLNKNPVEYIVSPSPLKWGSEQKINHNPPISEELPTNMRQAMFNSVSHACCGVGVG